MARTSRQIYERKEKGKSILPQRKPENDFLNGIQKYVLFRV
jgi:hypothetical protein